jgi:hypothetical protein
MILSELKRYLSQHQLATMWDMAVHFDVEPDALRGMLTPWIQKGRVRKRPPRPICAGCSLCDPTHLEVYEWIG